MTAAGPLGAHWDGSGTHFRVFSSLATAVELCLFDGGTERRIEMDAEPSFVWHTFVPDVGSGQAYGFRVHGPYEPAKGLRCNPAKVLVDPYARALGRAVDLESSMFSYPLGGDDAALDLTDNAAAVPKSYVVDTAFDWQSDRPPRHPPERTIVYELHVKGFTQRHPCVPEELRGTYAGLATPPALEAMLSAGVTTVELLPVHQFAHERHLLEAGRRNYWGYHTYGFFAPHAEYAVSDDRGGQVHEFKRMIKAFHAVGLEVLLDVVYNHTAEGNHLGPTINFKGFDNPAYYHLVADDPHHSMDYTGTGNSFNVRHPYALQLVLDSLRYWVTDMHVDGFRFDLAATLARSSDGVDTWSAFFCAIHQDPVLQQVKLIAEPWDMGQDGHLLGRFPYRWSEWNDRYRETMRHFWCQEPTNLRDVATCLLGSADIFQEQRRGPSASLNYICSHDGFTLRDMVDSSPRLNGVEAGAARDEARRTLQRSLLGTLLLSVGTPMIGAGDEWGRSQQGHEDAYDQDNEISWLDWSSVDDGLRTIVREVALREDVPWLRQSTWPGEVCRLTWIKPDGTPLDDKDWKTASGSLALQGSSDGRSAVLILNGGEESVSYTPLGAAHRSWRLAWTSAAAPDSGSDASMTPPPFEVPGRAVALYVQQADAA